MKVLHTSDWHIGKKLMGRERYGEYRAVLSEIRDIAEREGVELCLVAGDVYDTYTPSAEAEEIFFEGIKAIAENCAVLIISGNHDDYIRLTASSSLAQELNIYIIGNNLRPVKCEKRGKCFPVSSDGGYIIFENLSGERVYVNALPYPNEARFKEDRTEESFTEKMTRWIEYGQRGNTSDYPSIFLSHIFVAGGKAGDTEREIDLGGARLVPKDILPKCVYAALGHLHKRQQIGENVFYCGSPMRFSFDEANAEKSVNVFDIGENGVTNFRQVRLGSIKSLVRLQALTAEDGIKLLNENKEAFVELTLNLSAPLSHAQTVELHKCENLISLKTDVDDGETHDFTATRKDKSASELFDGFYKLKYGVEPSAKLKELFLQLTEGE